MSQPQSLPPEPIESGEESSSESGSDAAGSRADRAEAESAPEAPESEKGEHPAFSTSPSATPEAPSPAPTVEPPARRKRWKFLSILLLLGLILCLAQILQQARQLAGLEAEVSILNNELLQSQEQISAYQLRLVEIRSEVTELLQGLGVLRDLVDREVTTPGSPPDEVLEPASVIAPSPESPVDEAFEAPVWQAPAAEQGESILLDPVTEAR